MSRWLCLKICHIIGRWVYPLVETSQTINVVRKIMLSDLPEGINIVSVSEVNPPKPKPVMKEKELSPSQQADKELMARYNEVLPQCVPFTTLRSAKIKSDDLRQIFALLSTKKFSMIDIRSVIIPICIEKRIEMNSFWRFIQRKRRP